MKNSYLMSGMVVLLMATSASYAQCPPGDLPVTVEVQTDDFGYDCFWDVTPIGFGCGVSAWFTFGNTAEVSCGGGGAQVATDGNGYPSNATIVEDLGCLTESWCFDIHAVDDYGDGGISYTVYIDGIASYWFVTTDPSTEETFTFCVNAPPVNNIDMTTEPFEYSALPISQASNIIADGMIASLGTGDITGAYMNVSVMFGPTQVYNETSSLQDIASGDIATFTVPAFTPTATGTYVVNYVSSMTEVDEEPMNNVTSYSVFVSDSVYARDNGVFQQNIGIGAGEAGFIGTAYTIVNPIHVSSISVLIGNQAADITGNAFSVAIFSTDGAGTPVASLASADGVVSSGVEQWHTVQLNPPVYLTPGEYVFTVSESTDWTQQIGTSLSIVTPNKNWASWTSFAWATFDALGVGNLTCMIRPNLNEFTGVSESVDLPVSIYPNPTTGILYIQSESVGATACLYDASGKLVETFLIQQEHTTLDLSAYSRGVYSLRMTNGATSHMSKLILN